MCSVDDEDEEAEDDGRLRREDRCFPRSPTDHHGDVRRCSPTAGSSSSDTTRLSTALTCHGLRPFHARGMCLWF